MNRFRNAVLRRCKSLSSSSRRPSASSYSNLRSLSTRDGDAAAADGAAAVVFVGSSRRRYEISAEHLRHPLVAALVVGGDDGRRRRRRRRQAEEEEPPAVAVNCEVVLFDHLLWMLDSNAVDLDDDAMRELAQLYCVDQRDGG